MRQMVTKKRAILGLILLGFVGFLGWRFVRPMNIFVVSPAFERPISTAKVPDLFDTLSAKECASCHVDVFKEWSTTMHSKAWTDPYFQVDFVFDGSLQICKNCHIPLDRQQEHLVLGFHDKEKWDPILAPNPNFDRNLQQEGVTCAVCHLKEGKIVGPTGSTHVPHPVSKIEGPNQMCVRCHVVDGKRWDTFYRFPPCGTVAEIQATRVAKTGEKGGATPHGTSGEITAENAAALGCVECHMPVVRRPVVAGGEPRLVRRHIWRGGHDPDMVKKGLDIKLTEAPGSSAQTRRYTITLTNVGAAHYLPTGTPDRHLTVRLRTLDAGGKVLDKQNHKLGRTVMWRPFIIDLWDTRLPRWKPRTFDIEVPTAGPGAPAALEAVVHYFLVDEKRRVRIGYDDKDVTFYEVFRRRLKLVERSPG